jgi:hypothetical protein
MYLNTFKYKKKKQIFPGLADTVTVEVVNGTNRPGNRNEG